MRQFAVTVIFAALLCGCGENDAPSASEPVAAEAPAVAVPATPVELSAETKQRLSDLASVKTALEAYASANSGGFPKTEGENGYKSNWGKSLGENWIPELVPTYIAKLPRDPAMSEEAHHHQYIYVSDGKDYKLIAVYSGDCSAGVEGDGVKIDHKRQDASGCWAYGYWTPGAAEF